MAGTLPDRLIEHLRAALGAKVAFAAPPAPLSGGFDTTILAFDLKGAAPDYGGGLVLRLMPRAGDTERVRREAAIHAALVAQGYPAPRVLLAVTDAAPLGRPFLVLQRLAGANMWLNAFGPGGRARRILGFSRTLASAQARLHRLDPSGLATSLEDAGVDPAELSVEGELRRLVARIEAADLKGLGPGAAWLADNRPAPAAEAVICHGDFHPLNLVMDGMTLSGVVDWSQTILAEPAYDIAATKVLLQFGPIDAPPRARALLDAVRSLPIRRYVRFYRAERPFEVRNLTYFEGLRVMSALVFAGETPPGQANPWRKPHALAALCRRFARISGIVVRL